MDVALYHDQPPFGGAYRVLREYLRHSAEAHRFTLYTRRPEERGLIDLTGDLEIRRFPLSAPAGQRQLLLRLLALPCLGREMARHIDAGDHDVLFCHMSELVGAPEVLPSLRTPSLLYAPEQWRAIYDRQPDWLRDRSLAGRLAERGLGPASFLRKRLDRRNIRAATRVVAHSRFTARRLSEVYGVEAAVVHLGVELGDFAPGGPRQRVVLSVGALHPLKGHQFVVEALATLPPPRPPLVVVGDRGSAGTALRALAKERGVDLRLEQAIPQQRVVELYRSAGVLACAQYEEPFGLIALEAMATATPVVAVREGGFAETVDDGVTGLLVQRDRRAFGHALRQVLDDVELARRLGEEGRRQAAEHWTWEATAAGFDALLEETAGRSAAVVR